MSGILHKFLGDAFTLDGKEGGLNVEKMHEVIKKEKPIMNILLMGAAGMGKSSLINGLFGQEVAKAGEELLNLTKKWNIPTIVVFTNTQEKAGDAFVKEAQKVINEEWGFGGFVRAYVRVNSVAYSLRGIEVPVEGLKELVDETKKCLIDAKKNKTKAFLADSKS
ncbi:hypothetical protein HpBT252_05130 [Helicobacter pylori]